MRLQPIPRRLSARLALTTALVAGLMLAACGQGPTEDDTPPAESEVAAPPDMREPPVVDAGTAAAPSSGPPSYAAPYPGAEPSPAPDEPATDLGGSVTFITADSPEAVIDFYQAKARASGLSTVSALKQGETQAYAAVDSEGRGATLRVVAAPAESDDSQTQVSVSWTVAQ